MEPATRTARENAARIAKNGEIAELKARFAKATSTVFLNFQGMNVETATQLRAEFRKAGVEYKVTKNTLVKQALKGHAYTDKLKPTLIGMTGLAWSYEDPSAAAKVVKAFRKGAAGEKIQVKAGLVDGSVLDGKAVEDQLASMPGKNELRSMLLATFQAPLQQFVALLQAPSQNFAYLLAAKEREETK